MRVQVCYWGFVVLLFIVSGCGVFGSHLVLTFDDNEDPRPFEDAIFYSKTDGLIVSLPPEHALLNLNDEVFDHTHYCDYDVNPIIGDSSDNDKVMLIKIHKKGDGSQEITITGDDDDFFGGYLFNKLSQVSDQKGSTKVHLICEKTSTDKPLSFSKDDAILTGNALQYLVNIYVENKGEEMSQETKDNLMGFGDAPSAEDLVNDIKSLIKSF